MSTLQSPDRCVRCEHWQGDQGCERGAAPDEDCPLDFNRSLCLLAPACQDKECDNCYVATGIKEMELCQPSL